MRRSTTVSYILIQSISVNSSTTLVAAAYNFTLPGEEDPFGAAEASESSEDSESAEESSEDSENA